MDSGAAETEELLTLIFKYLPRKHGGHGNGGIKKSPKFLWGIYIFWSLPKLRLIICNYFLTYITSFTALTTRSAFGKLAAIKVGEYGSGTSAQVIRKTGASK